MDSPQLLIIRGNGPIISIQLRDNIGSSKYGGVWEMLVKSVVTFRTETGADKCTSIECNLVEQKHVEDGHEVRRPAILESFKEVGQDNICVNSFRANIWYEINCNSSSVAFYFRDYITDRRITDRHLRVVHMLYRRKR